MSLLKRTHPSADRNSAPILAALKKIFNLNDKSLKCLDTASGSGQHVGYFAPHFPNITFQPSEYDEKMLPSILAYAQECQTRNICDPMKIDIEKPHTQWGMNLSKNDSGCFLDDGKQHRDFKELSKYFDYMININMIHISPIECTVGLFKNAGSLLKLNGLLITYGAYSVNGKITPQSNVDFDGYLKTLDERYGIRDLYQLNEMAKLHGGIELQDVQDMPANNKLCVWKKVQELYEDDDE